MNDRTLKFRLWNGHKMLYAEDCDFVLSLDGNILSPIYDALETPRGIKSMRVMQFTGLLDINGKEIWEGDIVQSDYGRSAPSMVIEVVRWCDEESGFRPFLCCSAGFVPCDSEIIGNIYENPELLK